MDRLGDFSPGTFRRRRDRALGQLEGGALLLPAAPVLHRTGDTAHRYRPDSELFYLTGCTEPECVALLRGGDEGEGFILFLPERDPKAELWTGPRLDPDEARERFGADAVMPRRELDARLPGLLEAATRLYFRLGRDPRMDYLVVEVLREARSRGARKGTGLQGVLDPGEILDEMRLRKDPEEVEAIRRATTLTVSAFRDTIPRVAPGMGEWEVEALLERAIRRRGASGPAFPTIVGSGANACTLHYAANASTLGEDSLVLLDGGAEVGLYSGDVTRTFPAGGRFTLEQRAIYEIVRRAREGALATLRPGASVEGVHESVVWALTVGLRELGVLSGEVEDLLQDKAYQPWFPHQTCHWLGLDVHDPGKYKWEGCPRLLEVGMVLAVEPGLYFPPVGEGSGRHFQGIGVRIEDDILITDEGWENLSWGVPTTPEALEEMVGSALG